MYIDVTFTVDEILEAMKIDLAELPLDIAEKLKLKREITLEAEIEDCDAFDAMDDEFIDMRFECWAEANEPGWSDLKDGLQALVDGDRSMACILLSRAFDDFPDAVRLVEDVLRKPTSTDPRQLALSDAGAM